MDDIAIQFVLTGDDGYSGPYTSTSDLQAMVDWANDVFELAGIRFTFQPNDIQHLSSTLLNQDMDFPLDGDARNLPEFHHVVYSGHDNHVYEIYNDTSGGWHYSDLTAAVNGIEAEGLPYGYTSHFDSVKHVVFLGRDRRAYELYAGDSWQATDLTAATGGVEAASWISAYTTDHSRVQHVLFTGFDRHVYELYAGDGWQYTDLTQAVGGIQGEGRPFGYTTDHGTTQNVVFVGAENNHLYHLAARPRWEATDLTDAVGGVEAGGKPFAYTTDYGKVPHIVVRGRDGNVYEFYFTDRWRATNISAAIGGTIAMNDPIGYVTDDYDTPTPDIQHVLFRGAPDNRLYEAFAGDAWQVTDLTAAVGQLKGAGGFGYTTRSRQDQNVLFRDDGPGHVWRLTAGRTWTAQDIGAASGAPNLRVGPHAFADGWHGARLHEEERHRVASQYGSKLVVFLRHGRFPTGTANFSNSLHNYLALVSTNSQILAHELGHFFHLPHTFGEWPKNKAEAEKSIKRYVDIEGNRPEDGAFVFDGDRGFINDTPPDPGTDVWKDAYSAKYGDPGFLCSSEDSLTLDVELDALDGQSRPYTLTPPRANLMSYFDRRCPQFSSKSHLSADQVKRIRRSLSLNRKYLL